MYSIDSHSPAMSALPIPAPPIPSPAAARLAASARSLAGLGVPVWRAGELAGMEAPTAPSGWPSLDAELPGGGWPLTGLSELLFETVPSGELALLQPWLRALARGALGSRELLWVAPPGLPCAAALQAMELPLERLVCVQPASAADAAWAVEQALRAGSCAAVLWWAAGPTVGTILRRLHLAAQAGATPLMALRPAAARGLSSPAPLRLVCAPLAGRCLAVDVFKRRGPPMAAPLLLSLPWPASARRARSVQQRNRDVVDRPAPAATPLASPALVATGT